ncbi:hypothetical protein E2493_20315 [Sphingomonas parva]|uniref:Uncharacterized protein n=1 Tax=Sphingomonas parva TaxID=2555898 RepID=A0A4Y8ZKE8_9SPHN|nr:hypothetical protein [Sphingomonas parva]TFI56414.1 hypothetical protein E2493_20315 [Sphingomonas parva]
MAEEALAHRGAALIEAVIDPDGPFLPPRRRRKYVGYLEKALDPGAAGADRIRRPMREEPERTMLQA